jgi:putative transcriptional regulator
MITETLIKGQLLISEPSIIDLSFRSVILLADHDGEGSVGL